jgi:glycosyltransferase involved in cell wall biosynthesis
VVSPQGSLEEWALAQNRWLKRLYAAFVEKPYFDRAACLQALTAAEADQFQRFGIRAPVAILPNGVDLEAIDRVPKAPGLAHEWRLSPGHKVILFLARLCPKKGLDLLAPAFGELLRKRQDLTLAIAGHDAGTGYRREVERSLDAANAGQRVRFLGELRGDRKFQVFRGADLYVLPSYSEGLPVSALEAMACGLPVVITPGCHLSEVEPAEAGWIVPPTSDALAAGLDAAFADDSERLRRGRNARRLIEEQFTWPEIAARSITLYQQILDQGARKLPRSPSRATQLAQ